MFTGLIEDIGIVKNITRLPLGILLKIETKIKTSEIVIGDSIACNGACLTATKIGNNFFEAELSHETVKLTTWKDAKPGQKANLERALRLGDRLGGHIVSGHIDGIGKISKSIKKGQAIDITINCPADILKYIVAKGSIAIDGISLTVNKVDTTGFMITLIPHSQDETTLSSKRVGMEVNLECDIIGKYVESMITKGGKLDRSFLAKLNYL